MLFVVPLEPEEHYDRFDCLLKYPHVRAFLDTIAYAEGTLHEDGYRVLYGGAYFDDFDDHPRQVIQSKRISPDLFGSRRSSSELASTAAGRYQILEKTWDAISRSIAISDFSPHNQDKAALKLIDSVAALQDVLDKQPERAWKKIASIWPSLPDGAEQQCRVSLYALHALYHDRLAIHNAQ